MTPGFAPVIPQPEPLPLPAPVWLLWGLLLLTFALHLVAMNLLLGGGVLTAYARIRHGGAGKRVAALFAGAMPVLIAATVTLGVAPLLFLQVLYGRLFFVSSILMAWIWLAIVPAVILLYYSAYVMAARVKRGASPGTWVWTLMAIGLAAIAFVLTTNMTLMLGADRFAPLYATGSGWHLNFTDPTLWPRWLHMLLGAVAVGGLGLALAGFVRQPAEPEFAGWARRFGARWGAVATGVNLLIGAWWLAALPAPVLQKYLGGSVAGVLVLAAGIAAGALALALLVALSRPDASAATAGGAVAALLVTIVAMILVRDGVRTATLGVVGFVPQSWVAPQWPTIGLFAVLLVGALSTVGWMVWTLVRAPAVAR